MTYCDNVRPLHYSACHTVPCIILLATRRSAPVFGFFPIVKIYLPRADKILNDDHQLSTSAVFTNPFKRKAVIPEVQESVSTEFYRDSLERYPVVL